MDVKLFDLKTENSWIKENFFRRLNELYDDSEFISGYKHGPVEEIEEIFARHCARKHALGVGSGTLALEMAARALELKAGDEVVVPANTFVATASAPASRGATIVAADIDPDTWNLSWRTVEPCLSAKTKAVFAVSLYGNPFDYFTLQKELKDRGIALVEDGAHSHGASLCNAQGTRVTSGRMGDLSAFSFFPSKVIGGIGDSGMLLTDSDETVEKMRAYRNCGQTKKHYAGLLGSVSRMDVIQAAFLVEKWRIFPRALEQRQKIAALYDARFAGTPVGVQKLLPQARHAYFVYVIRVKARERLREHLTEKKIPWSVQYPFLLTQQDFWKQIPTRQSLLSEAERFVDEVITIPLHSSTTESEAHFVADEVLKCVG